MTLCKVKPGDPLKIPAEAFITFIDAAQGFLRRRDQGHRQEAGRGAH